MSIQEKQPNEINSQLGYESDLSNEDFEKEIQRLAQLKIEEYELQRKQTAKLFDVRPNILDKIVEKRRIKYQVEQEENEWFDKVEPFSDPVNGKDLLNEINTQVKKYIVCDEPVAIATTLWILFTWAIDHMNFAPIACITAPEKRCGKTQLLTLIGELSKKNISASNITSAALYRTIDMYQPTLTIDEADTFLSEQSGIRGVMNAGHSRENAFVIRCDGEDNHPKRFNVWCAKAISGIGHLPETLRDRSIVLELRRKVKNEHIESLRDRDKEYWKLIKRKCLRWVNDNQDLLRAIKPVLPECLNDRAKDNWEGLFKIAAIAGEDWLERVEFAAISIQRSEEDNVNLNEQLLLDIHSIFKNKNADKLFTKDILSALYVDEEKPWRDICDGRSLSARKLATMLKGFKISSHDIRIGDKVKKGYELVQFTEAFERYL